LTIEADVKEWLGKSGMIFLKDIGIKEGQVVLDFGCNVGHYAIPAAKVAGKKGKVYAADNDMKSLNELMETAKREKLTNIVPMHTQSVKSGINLKDGSVDVILLYDVLHYMDVLERNKIYNESHRVLENDALLSVYPKHNKLDEPLWNLSDMRLEDIIKEIESANFKFERRFYKELMHDDDYNMGYILNFTKQRKER
jgi:ubiquinone/menaquinone biosynthesis C-methylase UbiE